MPKTFSHLLWMNPADEMFARAKEMFGTTNDVREAGYILPDGTLLDFSGAEETFHPEVPGRYMEHKEICRAVKGGHDPKHPGEFEPYDEGEENKCIDVFQNKGAIRFAYISGSNRNLAGPGPEIKGESEIFFELNVANNVTPLQWIALRRALQLCKRDEGLCNITADITMPDGRNTCTKNVPMMRSGSLKDMDDISDIYNHCRKEASTMKREYGEVKNELDITKVIKEEIRKCGVSPYRINAGDCGVFSIEVNRRIPEAEIVATEAFVEGTESEYRFPAPNVIKDPYGAAHVFLFYKDKFYDAEAPYGVKEWEDLPYFQELKKLALSKKQEYGEVKKEEKSTMKDLMAGRTLNGYVEAAKVKPLTEFDKKIIVLSDLEKEDLGTLVKRAGRPLHMNWLRTYQSLLEKGLLRHVERGKVIFTERGKQVLEGAPVGKLLTPAAVLAKDEHVLTTKPFKKYEPKKKLHWYPYIGCETCKRIYYDFSMCEHLLADKGLCISEETMKQRRKEAEEMGFGAMDKVLGITTPVSVSYEQAHQDFLKKYRSERRTPREPPSKLNGEYGEVSRLTLKEQMIDKAMLHFGVTNNPQEAGFILDDGRMLDFSGKRLGNPPGRRLIDHSEISFALPESFDWKPIKEGAVSAFTRVTNALRFSMSGQGNKSIMINMNPAYNTLTPAQFKTVTNALYFDRPMDLIYEIDDGDITFYSFHKEGAFGGAVGRMRDALNFFKVPGTIKWARKNWGITEKPIHEIIEAYRKQYPGITASNPGPKYIVKVYRDPSGALIEPPIQTSSDEESANKIYKGYQAKGYNVQMFRT